MAKLQIVSAEPWTYNNPLAYVFGSIFGYNQQKAMQASARSQQDYEAYLKKANLKAYEQWKKNVPGRSIANPEFSYPGQAYRSSTAYTRAGYDYVNAGYNYYGNLPYRGAGLFGITSKFSRYL